MELPGRGFIPAAVVAGFLKRVTDAPPRSRLSISWAAASSVPAVLFNLRPRPNCCTDWRSAPDSFLGGTGVMGSAFFISDSLTVPVAVAPAAPDVLKRGPTDGRFVADHLDGSLPFRPGGRVAMGGVLADLTPAEDGAPMLARKRVRLKALALPTDLLLPPTPAWRRSLLPRQVEMGLAVLGRGETGTRLSCLEFKVYQL